MVGRHVLACPSVSSPKIRRILFRLGGRGIGKIYGARATQAYYFLFGGLCEEEINESDCCKQLNVQRFPLIGPSYGTFLTACESVNQKECSL